MGPGFILLGVGHLLKDLDQSLLLDGRKLIHDPGDAGSTSSSLQLSSHHKNIHDQPGEHRHQRIGLNTRHVTMLLTHRYSLQILLNQ
jgi:hypothetical protein